MKRCEERRNGRSTMFVALDAERAPATRYSRWTAPGSMVASRRDARCFALLALLMACGSADSCTEGLAADEEEIDLSEIPQDAAATFAEHVCDAVSRCGCAVNPFGDGEEDCRVGVAALFEARVARLDDPGFVESCFDEALAWVDDHDCRLRTELMREDYPSACLLMAGSKGVGEACQQAGTTLYQAHDCNPGLQCYRSEECRSKDQKLEKSEPGGPCSDLLYCPSGYFCQEGVCEERRLALEPCTADFDCIDGLYCAPADDGSGVCEPRAAVGEACVPIDGNPIGNCDPPCVTMDQGGGTLTACDSSFCVEGTCSEPMPLVCNLLR